MPLDEAKDTDPTLGRIVNDIRNDLTLIVQKEIELAKLQVVPGVKYGGIGAGLFALAAFLLLMMLIMLSVTIAYFINWNGDGLALHWSFLIVTGVYLLGGAVAGLLGVRFVKRISGPDKAVEQAQLIGPAISRELKSPSEHLPAGQSVEQVRARVEADVAKRLEAVERRS